MKRQLNLSKKEHDEFINHADFDLIIDIYEEMMIMTGKGHKTY